MYIKSKMDIYFVEFWRNYCSEYVLFSENIPLLNLYTVVID